MESLADKFRDYSSCVEMIQAEIEDAVMLVVGKDNFRSAGVQEESSGPVAQPEALIVFVKAIDDDTDKWHDAIETATGFARIEFYE